MYTRGSNIDYDTLKLRIEIFYYLFASASTTFLTIESKAR